MKVVNGREIPDIAGELTNQEGMNMLADILGECANAFSATVDGDTLALTSLSTAAATITGNASVGGILGVTGNATVGGTLGVTGAITASAGVAGAVTGNVTGNLTGNVTGDINGSTISTDVADGTIPATRLAMVDGSGNTVVGTANSLNVIGVNVTSAVSTDAITLRTGKTQVITSTPVGAGRKIKCSDNGRVTQLVTSEVTGTTIQTVAAGGAFANQPANDGVTVVSAEAADTTQTVTIIGTTHGGVVVVTEDIVLTGTTPVNSVKTDWGIILAIKLSAVTAGNVTVKETSGSATIKVITDGGTSSGVTAVTAASQGAFGVEPTVVSDDATTKIVGVKYVNNSAATAYQAVALNGATAATFATAAELITEVYTGDVEAARSATVKVGAEEYLGRSVGKSLAAALAAGTTINALIFPN